MKDLENSVLNLAKLKKILMMSPPQKKPPHFPKSKEEQKEMLVHEILQTQLSETCHQKRYQAGMDQI